MAEQIDSELSILFDQKKCLVVNKPGGLLTQAPPGIDSMELRVKRLIKSYRPHDVNAPAYVGVPHRLDRPVSGVMVFGKNKPTTKSLSSQFQNRQVRKVYWAVVAGEVHEKSGTWTDFMRKLPDQAKSEIVSQDHRESKRAELAFTVLGQSDGLSWLRIELQTGRTHQIRLQAASRNTPILGDQMYGSEVSFGPDTTDLRARWISLHARYLEFTLPETDKRATIAAPLPEWWDQHTSRFPEMLKLHF